jgi:two-component system, LytTR family, sensor kinase
MQAKSYWYNKVAIRIFLHLVFLTIVYYILFIIFKVNSPAVKMDYIYPALFLLTLLPVTYINLEWLIPSVAGKKKWLLYALALVVLIAISVWLNTSFFEHWSSWLLPNLFFISYYTWWEILLFLVGIIGISTLLKLSKSWLTMAELQQKLLQVEKENIDIELKALKSQINPHFLFNTLNSIYSLSLDKDERLPQTVLKMSGIMRYYLYESKEDFVPLQKEIQVLNDYIDLQRIRSSEKLQVKKTISVDGENKCIAPLLLLTFVENAFKHGAKSSTAESFINIRIALKEENFYFSIQNNKGLVDDVPGNNYSGLGLQNVKRRLELIYPSKYQLQIDDTDKVFSVTLKLIL